MFQIVNDLYFMFRINSLYLEKILSHILKKYDYSFWNSNTFRFEASCEVGIIRFKIKLAPRCLEYDFLQVIPSKSNELLRICDS
jgi:hypothetical protein